MTGIFILIKRRSLPGWPAKGKPYFLSRPSCGVFSGLNQLNDLTIDLRYGDICGYTQTDVDINFAPWLTPLNAKFTGETIRAWYNGYYWGNERVYNPFDILLLCDKQELRPWWFETGYLTIKERFSDTFRGDSASLRELFTSFFASIPADNYRKTRSRATKVFTQALCMPKNTAPARTRSGSFFRCVR